MCKKTFTRDKLNEAMFGLDRMKSVQKKKFR